MVEKVEKSEIVDLIRRFYNLNVDLVEFFDAYEDTNLKITASVCNGIACHSSDFVLKLTKTFQPYIGIDFETRAPTLQPNLSKSKFLYLSLYIYRCLMSHFL